MDPIDQRRKKERRILRRAEAEPWILGILAALMLHLLATTLHTRLEHAVPWTIVGIPLLPVALGLVLIGLLVRLYRRRGVLFRPHTRYLHDATPDRHEHLILFLSNLDFSRRTQGWLHRASGIPRFFGPFLHLDPAITPEDFQHLPVAEGNSRKLVDDIAHLTELKRGDGVASEHKWSWEMPLRAILHHIGAPHRRHLKSLTVVCSPQSIQQFDQFRQLLNLYSELQPIRLRLLQMQDDIPEVIEKPPLQDDVPEVIEKLPQEQDRAQGISFESFDALSRAVTFGVEYLLLHDEGITEDQIIIDMTGGQKVTSVVASAITFNRKIEVQYIQTNDPWRARSYDIVQGSSEIGGLGP